MLLGEVLVENVSAVRANRVKWLLTRALGSFFKMLVNVGVVITMAPYRVVAIISLDGFDSTEIH
jgi:hypothetical protein